MFKPSVKVKMAYFDASILKTNWKAINDGPLKRAGLLVRKIARNSIKRGRRAYARSLRGLEKLQKRIEQWGHRNIASPPGKPPRWWTGSSSSVAPFKRIVSIPTSTFGVQTGVIVGMVAWPRRGEEPIPGLHELGGAAIRRVPVDKNLRPLKYRKRRRKRVRYPARPFMRPAERKARQTYPRFWRNALKNIRKK